MKAKINLQTLLAMAVILLGFGCTIASGEVIYVDANAPPGGNGQTWATAYKYLQDALNDPSLSYGDDIWVSRGMYKPDETNTDPNGTGNREATFQLVNGVSIHGGLAGNEDPGTFNLDDRDFVTNETILSGNIGNVADSCDNSYHVVTGSGTDGTAVLDGFTITAGYADGPDEPSKSGGGMYNVNGSPTVANCTFSSNTAIEVGGGMFNNEGSPTVTNCTFSGNLASVMGGGMYDENSNSTLANCIFRSNSAGPGGSGGAIRTWNSSMTVTNCSFIGNSALIGGGMFTHFNTPTLVNCTFNGNTASGTGGAMHNVENNPIVTNCILWGNTASYGNEIYNDSSTPVISYSDIAGSGGSDSWDSSLGSDGGGNIDEDPLFADPNGEDGIAGTLDDDLRLTADSNCIDAGDNTAPELATVTTDLDGNPRFVNIPWKDDSGNGTPPIVDMGAYEFQTHIGPVWHVKVGGTGDGSSWEHALGNLQDAFYAAQDGHQIWVAAGTYTPAEPGGSRLASFQLKNGVAIYGGFAGTETALQERDWQANETVLSGDVNDDDSSYSLMEDFLQCYTGGATSGCEQFDLNEDTYVNCEDLYLFLEAYHYHDNSYHVVTGSGTNSTAVLDGFTITAGNADGIWDDKTSVGGGMYNDNGSPTVANCIFSRNRAHQYGGGMYNNSNPNLINCTFIENSVPGLHCYGGATNGFGGGMCNYQNYLIGPSTLLGCEFIKNWADIGAGMYNYASSPTMSNCIIKENYSISDGAGMYNQFMGSFASDPVVTNCTFISNTSKGHGGGMYNWNSSSNMKVTNCTFSGNCSWFNAGGMVNYCSSPVVTNCTFSGNISWPYVGGQLYMGGGGMYNTGCYCTPNLTNCTFSGNWTRYAGGGIYNAYSNPTMTNCILWGNSGEQIHNEASSPTVSYSDIQGGYGDTGNIDDDPCFVDPNGPDGEIGTEDDNLRLSTESPCIDTGDPNYSDANYPTDLDGRDRFVDGDCNDTVIVDMGAYEFTSAYYGDFDGDCDVDFIDYAIQANYWLTDGFLVDIAPTPAGDGVIDERDLAILCINWLVGTEP